MKSIGHELMNADGRPLVALRTVFVLAGLLCSAPAALAQTPPRIEVVFRYDDYSSVSFTGFETRLLRVFEKTQTPLTVGVIPFPVAKNYRDVSPQPTVPLTEEKAAILREAIEAGIVEPALHGYNHQSRPRPLWGQFSEFKGLSQDEQMRRIREGKEFLEKLLNRDIKIFIPPWNVEDRTTHIVLERLGFLGVSSGFDGGGGAVSDKTSLKFLPATSELARFYESLRSARRASCPTSVIIVILHDYDFAEVDTKRAVTNLEAFSEMLTSFAKQSDLRVAGMSEVMSRPEYGAALFAKNKKYMLSENLIYPWLTDLFNLNTGFYLCEPHLSTVYPKSAKILFVYAVTVLLACIGVGFKGGRLVFARWPWSVPAAWLVTLAVLAFLVYDIQKDADMSYKGLTGLLMFSGFLLGEWLAFASLWLERRRRFKRGPLEEWMS